MANSSDWLGALAAARLAADIDPGCASPSAPPSSPAEPGWLALLEPGEGFRAALPFGLGDPSSAPPKPPQLEPEPQSEPQPEPDPQAEALARAFAQGEAAGRAAAEAEGAARAARQRALRLSFHALDEAARGVLAEDLAATVLALCEGVLGEAATGRAGLLARCQLAAQRIGGAADALVLHLHPDDMALLDAGALGAMRLAPDPELERGGLRIEGPDGSVADGPTEWRRALAAAVQG